MTPNCLPVLAVGFRGIESELVCVLDGSMYLKSALQSENNTQRLANEKGGVMVIVICVITSELTGRS